MDFNFVDPHLLIGNSTSVSARNTIVAVSELSTRLPPEHQQMILTIAEIPPRTTKTKTKDQQMWLINENNFNRWIGLRLDYLQQKQLGFLPPDPLENPLFDERFKPWITVESEYYFTILQITIEGWELIKKVALREKRAFPFNNPRELFVEIFREKTEEYASEKVFSTEIGAGTTLKNVRQNFRQSSKFLRGRLKESDQARELEECRQGRWREFWVYAIWNFRYKGQYKKLSQAWKNFLDAHKAMTAFLCSTLDVGNGEKLTSLKWNKGYAVLSATDSAIGLERGIVNVPPVVIYQHRA